MLPKKKKVCAYSPDKEKERKKEIVRRNHLIKMEYISLTFQYHPNLSSEETDPVIRFYTNVREVTDKNEGYFKEVTLGSSWYHGQDIDIQVPVRNNVKILDRGASLFVQVYAKERSTEGKQLYEKDGMTQVFLHNLVKEGLSHGVHHADKDTPEHTHHQNSPVVKEALYLQSLMFEKEVPVKGVINMRFHTRFSASMFREIRIDDYVPGNAGRLNALIQTSIFKAQSPFQTENNELRPKPTYPEMEQVMAPYWVSSAGVINGPLYWANVLQEDPWSEKIIRDSLRCVLDRYNMKESTFSQKMRENLDNDLEDTEFTLLSARILGETVCAPSMTVEYIADKRFVAAGIRKILKERVVENFGKLGPDMVETGGDCEDTGNFNGRMFVSIRDGIMRHESTRSLQDFCRLYACAGNLLSVSSRNVAEASQGEGGGEEPSVKWDINTHNATTVGANIGTPEDKKCTPGAHEMVQLIPKAVVGQWALRTSPSEYETMRWSDGTLINSIPESHLQLPIITCEGTGMLTPLILPNEAYYARKDHKIRAYIEQLKEMDAFTRMTYGKSVKDMYNDSTPLYPDTLAFLERNGQFLRGNDGTRPLINNPDKNVSQFYRLSREKFFIPEKNDPMYDMLFSGERAYNQSKGEIEVEPKEVEDKMAQTSASVVSFRKNKMWWLHTVGCVLGERPETYNVKEEDTKFALFNPQQKEEEGTYGVHTTDELNKRPFVGLWRMPQPTEAEFIGIRSVVKNLPPLTPVQPATGKEQKEMRELVELINVSLEEESKRPISSAMTSVNHYIRTRDFKVSMLESIKKHISVNPFIRCAKCHGEVYAKNMSLLRFEYLVDQREWKGIKNQEQLSFYTSTRS